MKIGFIGCGNMAQAMMGGMIRNKLCAPGDITVHDISPTAEERARSDFGVSALVTIAEVIQYRQL